MMLIDDQELITELADQFMAEAIEDGEVFSEALCNWAMNKAEKALGL